MIAPRHPRTAIGQLADGRTVMVVVRRTAVGVLGRDDHLRDGADAWCGSARCARCSSTAEDRRRWHSTVPCSTGRRTGASVRSRRAVMLQYYGVYAPPPLEAVVSPNGDGVAETQELSFKVVRPSTTTATLTASGRDDRLAGGRHRSRARRRTRWRSRRPDASPPPEGPAVDAPLPPAEGRWTLTVTALDDQGLGSTDDASVRGQLDAGVAARRARSRRRASDRRAGPTSAGRSRAPPA